MHPTRTPLLLAAGLALALSACGADAPAGPDANPAPTADAHEPAVPSPYGTSAQETRDTEEAKEADSPNDDGKEGAADDRNGGQLEDGGRRGN